MNHEQLYLDNGVKAQQDGKGDAWARMHREFLGRPFTMTDIDGIIGMQSFAANTGCRLFVEYVSEWTPAINIHTKFAIVALFDRKRNEAAIKRTIQPHFVYLHVARCLSEQQGLPVKFFYVFGEQRPPWIMREVNIKTGEYSSSPEYRCDTQSRGWDGIWELCGLTALRNQLLKRISNKSFVAPF